MSLLTMQDLTILTYAKDTRLTKEPRSAGDATSMITPYATENLPEKISLEHT